MKLLINFIFILLLLVKNNYAQIPIKDVLPVKVYISISDNIYHINDNIYLNIEVINKSSEPITFIKSDNKLENFKIYLLNLKNASLVPQKILYENIKYLKNREFTLFPDEIYKVRINLQDIFTIKEEGRYRIKVEFDPYPSYKESHTLYLSNPLYINIKPAIKELKEKFIIEKLRKEEEMKSYTPEGAIKFMLDAARIRNWNNYFLYQNLGSIILKYDNFRDRYLKASDVMKKGVIEEFKEYIKNRKDRYIESYKILGVNIDYQNNKSVVKCRITYLPPAVRRNFIYLFYLKKEKNKWILYDLEALTYLKE